MSSLDVVPVANAGDRKRFVIFPWRVYRGDPLWVPPLLPERLRAIDPEQGPFFRRGEAEFFLVVKDGRVAGTVCAAEDPPTNAGRGARECIFGFLEYMEDRDVFDKLIDTVTAWARSRNLDALFGPFNLDYEDGYGVLIEGRDRPPALLCGHSPPYYQTFMEGAGFEPARGDNLAYAIDPQAKGLARLARVAARLRSKGRYDIRGANLFEWDAEIDRVAELLSAGLVHLPDHIGWQRGSLTSLLEPFRTLADPDLVLFAEENGRTIGWLAGIPNLNEALIHANGLRRPWDSVRLALLLRRRPACLAVKSVIVLPEYWSKGVAALLFDEMAKRALAKGYTWADLSLTSADNPHTPLLASNMGAEIYKRYRVYRKPVG